ncbi:MAG: DMT family transporter [Eubacteriales bacterium]|nr:DMT family transporter [Eubacteriales bacterium]
MSGVENRKKGILYILLSAFAFAIMAVFVREAGDLPSAQKALFRNLVSFAFAALILLRSGTALRGPHHWLPLSLRATFGTIGVIANFYAIDHLPLGDANSLNKLSPFFAVLASAVILKEKIKAYQLISLIIAFGGAALILKPEIGGTALGLAHLLAVLGALTAGLAYTYVRKLGLLGESGAFIVFFFSAFSIVVLLPFALANYVSMSSRQLVFLLLAGLAASFGQLGITQAYRYAAARSISIYNYAQIPFAAILGLIFFAELPDLTGLFGYLLIIASAVFMYFYERKVYEQ